MGLGLPLKMALNKTKIWDSIALCQVSLADMQIGFSNKYKLTKKYTRATLEAF
jgi:hypothetical protein